MTASRNEQHLINFRELKLLEDLYIYHGICKNAALEISKRSFRSGDTAGEEIFHMWVHRLLKIFDSPEFKSEEWQELTDFFLQIIEQKTKFNTDVDKGKVKELIDVFLDVQILVEWFRCLVHKLNICVFCIILNFALEATLLFSEFYKECNIKNEIHSTLDNVIVTFKSILHIVNKNKANLKVTDVEEFSKLTALLDKLCTMGEQSAIIDMMTILEAWKCITDVSILCNKSLEFATKKPKHTTSWSTRPIKFLLEEICQKLKIIYRKDILQQPFETVDKFIRLANYYLKLLARLTFEFQHEDFSCPSEYLEVLILAKRTPCYLKNTKVDETKEKSIENGLTRILRMVYKNPTILEEMSNQGGRLISTIDCNMLSADYLMAVAMNKDVQFINKSIAILTKLYQTLIKNVETFCSARIYNTTVESFAVLTILNSSGELMRFLQLSVLQGDFMLCQCSVDVLLTVSRCSTTTCCRWLSELRFWLEWNEKFAPITTNPKEGFVRNLIRNYYDLCKTSKVADTCENHIQMLSNKGSDRFLYTVGMTSVSDSVDSLAEMTTRISVELLELMDKWQINKSIDTYYRMVFHMKLLTADGLILRKELMEGVAQVLFKLLQNEDVNLQRFGVLYEALLNLITAHKDLLSAASVAHLLGVLEDRVKKRKFLVPELILVFTFLRFNLTNSNHKESYENLCWTIGLNWRCKLVRLLSGSMTKDELDGDRVNVDAYKHITLDAAKESDCPNHCHPVHQPMKRLRVDSSSTLNVTLCDMLNKSQHLMKTVVRIDSSERDLVNDIVHNMQSLLQRTERDFYR